MSISKPSNKSTTRKTVLRMNDPACFVAVTSIELTAQHRKVRYYALDEFCLVFSKVESI